MDKHNRLLSSNGIECKSNCSKESEVSDEMQSRKEATRNTEGGKLLINELNQLSIEEKEDVRGSAVDESQELLERSLLLMDETLSKIRTDRSAYDKAVFMNPSYVKQQSFRVMFLRSELFDARKAAQRMVNYFHHKERLFGLDMLVKDIELTDLGEDDLNDMMGGHLQVLPNKDRSGRTVVVSFHRKNYNRGHENHVRPEDTGTLVCLVVSYSVFTGIASCRIHSIV